MKNFLLMALGVLLSGQMCARDYLINLSGNCEASTTEFHPDYRNYTIEAIAREVGFISKSTFNEAFKKESGLTPFYFQQNAKHTDLFLKTQN